MEGKSKTEYILEVIALIISGIGFVLFFTAGIMGFAKTDQSHNINYPRINSEVCSSHSFWNSDINAFWLSPARLHHRTVDNARLPAKIYSADACLLNCGASSPLR